MQIRFTKMHGLGNDYVYVDCFQQSLDGIDVPALCRNMSDRHRGIGADGLILVAPPEPGVDADVRMIMYNADGSRSEMCGNGVRCVGKYAYDRLGLRQPADPCDAAEAGSAAPSIRLLRVQTDRGVLELLVYPNGAGLVDRVRVNMGAPILTAAEIPVRLPDDGCVAAALQVDGRTLHVTCVSMGNPHAVAFNDDIDGFDLGRIGPMVEHHPIFPNRVNFHIARVLGRAEVAMRTWERGTGITQACGTGACAVQVAGILEGRLDRSGLVHLPGGDLHIAWPEDDESVYKTGPATHVFDGTWG